MDLWLVIVLVFVALVAALFVLGTFGAARHRRTLDTTLHAQLEEANAALAAARAEDRGWERSRLEAAAREAHTRAHPGTSIRELHLIQVVDRPGTEEDQARFRVMDDHGEHDVLLGRRGDDWVEVAS
jgi:hypothetical protein